MGGPHPRRYFSQRRRNRNAGPKSESKSFPERESVTESGYFTKPESLSGHQPIAEPKSFSRHQPFTEPKSRAQLQSNRHR
jgi:hypothetical protein